MDHKSPFTNNSSSFPDFETEILETIKCKWSYFT